MAKRKLKRKLKKPVKKTKLKLKKVLAVGHSAIVRAVLRERQACAEIAAKLHVWRGEGASMHGSEIARKIMAAQHGSQKLVAAGSRTMTQQFRHRGFQPADETQPIIEMFEDDVAPTNPDGTTMVKLWDNDITQTSVVTKHVGD